MKKVIGLAVAAIVLVLVVPGIHLVENAWLLLVANGFSVPHTSSIITFECSYISEGSGEYCLFGHDRASYYAACATEAGQLPRCDTDFLSYKKTDSIKCEDFNAHDARTWCLE